ncbi:MAG TPA: ethanolamine ammonia-lyase subunit EutB [Blastocatellia bacterium]|nr:ethanolamine ammonia-lyase subunit EutB [Blastocatellia bacterium]
MNAQELKQLLVLANRFKEGDLLVGGADDEQASSEARERLASIRLAEITKPTLVDDGVTETLDRSLDRQLANELSIITVAEIIKVLLSDKAARWVETYRAGLSSEAIAAVAKVMTDDELSQTARTLFNPLPGFGVAIGSRDHFGSRIQPNSPGDDDDEILFSILEGLSYGCGDVILGLNPASDDIETIIRLEDLLRRVVERLQLPTRYCVLSDITRQTTARGRTRVDVGFQSLAGTSAALAGMVSLDVDGIAELARGFEGLYFETGQGSEVTNGAAEGIDMVTLESRSYGVARAIRNMCQGADREPKWMIVNDVAGFIGPEVFRTAGQLLRACLEDTVMSKLHGLTMGLDVCATFHMGLDPQQLRGLTQQIVTRAEPAYLMAVAGNADPMLGYMTTSFRDHPKLRQSAGKRITSAMQQRLVELGVMNDNGELDRRGDGAASLYAAYTKAGGDRRSFETLADEAARKFAELREHGFDLGSDRHEESEPLADRRMQAIYNNARRALYASLDVGILAEASPRHVRVATRARDRDEYLSHPASGEMIRPVDAARLASLYTDRRPQVQIVISDGLNANAVNENLRELMPPLKRQLSELGCNVAETDVAIQNGRVRAGYHVGELMEAQTIIHLIGERPGTGLNLLSAYLTYGRDRAGGWRWSPEMDHSFTTAICGVHRRGKQHLDAAGEIAGAVKRMLDERRSGVELGKRS